MVGNVQIKGYSFSKALIALVFILFSADMAMFASKQFADGKYRKEKVESIEQMKLENTQMKFQLYYLNRRYKVLFKRYVADEKELAKYRNVRK